MVINIITMTHGDERVECTFTVQDGQLHVITEWTVPLLLCYAERMYPVTWQVRFQLSTEIRNLLMQIQPELLLAVIASANIFRLKSQEPCLLTSRKIIPGRNKVLTKKGASVFDYALTRKTKPNFW